MCVYVCVFFVMCGCRAITFFFVFRKRNIFLFKYFMESWCFYSLLSASFERKKCINSLWKTMQGFFEFISNEYLLFKLLNNHAVLLDYLKN